MTTLSSTERGEHTLLPCPFCGGTEIRSFPIRDGRKLQCKCGASPGPQYFGPLDKPSADERLIAAWNTRPEAADLISELVGAMEGLVNGLPFGPGMTDYELVQAGCEPEEARRVAAAFAAIVKARGGAE